MNKDQNNIRRRRVFETRMRAHANALETASRLRDRLMEVADLLDDCVRKGGQLLVCENGGSAAKAQHFTTEHVGRYCGNRRSLPVMALTADGTALT